MKIGILQYVYVQWIDIKEKIKLNNKSSNYVKTS